MKHTLERVLAILLLAYGLTAEIVLAVNAELTWDYAESDLVAAQVTEFRIYEGLGARCADPIALEALAGSVAAPGKVFARMGVPVASGPVCYEATAVNAAGESARSNRAQVSVETLAPGVPTGLTVTAE